MKKLYKFIVISVVLICFLFAGMQVGNSMNSMNNYPYYTVCEGGSCNDNWNATCCLEYIDGTCTECNMIPPGDDH